MNETINWKLKTIIKDKVSLQVQTLILFFLLSESFNKSIVKLQFLIIFCILAKNFKKIVIPTLSSMCFSGPISSEWLFTMSLGSAFCTFLSAVALSSLCGSHALRFLVQISANFYLKLDPMTFFTPLKIIFL